MGRYSSELVNHVSQKQTVRSLLRDSSKSCLGAANDGGCLKEPEVHAFIW